MWFCKSNFFFFAAHKHRKPEAVDILDEDIVSPEAGSGQKVAIGSARLSLVIAYLWMKTKIETPKAVQHPKLKSKITIETGFGTVGYAKLLCYSRIRAGSVVIQFHSCRRGHRCLMAAEIRLSTETADELKSEDGEGVVKSACCCCCLWCWMNDSRV